MFPPSTHGSDTDTRKGGITHIRVICGLLATHITKQILIAIHT
jgi:hypothetical protein